ncbi:hypothetical protein QJS10_CPB04g01194 [Acorus calamus]|uniref:Uncharacterized protein n=1 Tax=Acorus calamus TaxID=4465 RepID=A0AAV9F441_ACOCL|nr:hypothetical protein QJS10_CPB04g01194 [Acorus calamus]
MFPIFRRMLNLSNIRQNFCLKSIRYSVTTGGVVFDRNKTVLKKFHPGRWGIFNEKYEFERIFVQIHSADDVEVLFRLASLDHPHLYKPKFIERTSDSPHRFIVVYEKALFTLSDYIVKEPSYFVQNYNGKRFDMSQQFKTIVKQVIQVFEYLDKKKLPAHFTLSMDDVYIVSLDPPIVKIGVRGYEHDVEFSISKSVQGFGEDLCNLAKCLKIPETNECFHLFDSMKLWKPHSEGGTIGLNQLLQSAPALWSLDNKIVYVQNAYEVIKTYAFPWRPRGADFDSLMEKDFSPDLDGKKWISLIDQTVIADHSKRRPPYTGSWKDFVMFARNLLTDHNSQQFTQKIIGTRLNEKYKAEFLIREHCPNFFPGLLTSMRWQSRYRITPRL